MARIRSSVLWFVPHQHSSQSLPVVFLLPHQSRPAGFCVFFFFLLQWRGTGVRVSLRRCLWRPAAATTTTTSSPRKGVKEGLTAMDKRVWVWRRWLNLWPSNLVLKWTHNVLSSDVAPAMSEFEVGKVQRPGRPRCPPTFYWHWVKAVNCAVCWVVQVIFMCQSHVMQTILRNHDVPATQLQRHKIHSLELRLLRMTERTVVLRYSKRTIWFCKNSRVKLPLFACPWVSGKCAIL